MGMLDRKKVMAELESLRDICNAKSNMAIGNGKVAWAGYANAADYALAMLKEQPEIVRCKDCKNAEVLPWLDNAIICKKHNYTGVRPDEFYCADGKRRDDG